MNLDFPVLPMILFVGASVLVNAVLFRLYRPARADAGGRRSLASLLEYPAQALERAPYLTLFLVSFLVLFLELLLIRWVSSQIRIFAYFKNFVLIACFLGFGLGSSLCRRTITLLPLVGALLTVAVLIKAPSEDWWLFLAVIPSFIGALSEVHIWGVPEFDLSWSSIGWLAAAIAVIAPFFGLLTLIFIPLGQITGRCLEVASDGIRGYSVNLVASLCGIGGFTLLCFFWQPPEVWLLAGGVVALLLCAGVRHLRWACPLVFAVCAAFATLPSAPSGTEYWSPYQKLRLTEATLPGGVQIYDLSTNDAWYQKIIDLSPEFVARHPELFRDVGVEWNAYNLPYRFFPEPGSVLILGSGAGNDVAAALRNGAERVVAVEIDPLILDIGRRLHFEKPYASPRVEIVIDDARSYLQESTERFDLVVFSLLDSHTNSSHFSNVRIDSYVYTVEAMRAVQRLLSPDGLVIVKFEAGFSWIAGRLHGLLAEVFGAVGAEFRTEQAGYATGGSFYVAGSAAQIERALADPGLAEYVRTHPPMARTEAALTTDDWPYFYQHQPGLPAAVIAISVVLVLLCWITLSATGLPVRGIRWHFFFLGAGFLLLEVQIISKMALLFGTTWLVNSIVIAALLLLLVVANAVAKRWPNLPRGAVYAGLLLSLAVCWVVPMDAFFFASPWLKAASAGLVYCLPVFFAGIIFVGSFRAAGFSGSALGSNLMGALVGGLLESLSLWTGLSALLLIAGLLYLASMLCAKGAGRTAKPLAG
jgi:spermidine synthase